MSSCNVFPLRLPQLLLRTITIMFPRLQRFFFRSSLLSHLLSGLWHFNTLFKVQVQVQTSNVRYCNFCFVTSIEFIYVQSIYKHTLKGMCGLYHVTVKLMNRWQKGCYITIFTRVVFEKHFYIVHISNNMKPASLLPLLISWW